ncbi:16S rRNA (cytidine(1402)-2'-O)-methyltransferase [Ureaplasma ceti]|uniref:Ribosomal RNA small subunit methyltransferase I n=1 Tax=Ureaplasma ceti TaxID=3119530 RepID=A0ABP9U9R8_9BACT
MKTFETEKKLTVAASPIGNLNEVSFRFMEAMENADIVLCEDTRITGNLINLLNLENKPKLIKFEKFTENDKVNEAIRLINEGNKVVLVSDAGYPLISDPGYTLVSACEEHNIAVEVINGPSSITHALVASGLPTNTFMFLGFLGKSKQVRTNSLNRYRDLKTTFVILESVHRLQDCLKDLYSVLGDQKVAIARELTKKHEEIIRTTLSEAVNLDINLKGEFVLVVYNEPEEVPTEAVDLVAEIKTMLNNNLKTKEISFLLADKYNLDSKELYKKILEVKNDQ